MTDDLKDLESGLEAMRDDFVTRHNDKVDKAKEQHGARNISEKKIQLPQSSQPKDTPSRHAPSFVNTGYVVKLGVRKQRLSLDTIFEYTSRKLSELEAKFEAEKAAKEAGYPIIGYVYSVEKIG